MERIRGIVKWFNKTKRFGFLTTHDGHDIFVHANDLQGMDLKPGEKVEFETTAVPKGIKAVKITKVET